MKFTFVQLHEFVRRWNSLRLVDEDLLALEAEIAKNPLVGKVIPGVRGLRKFRFAAPSMHRGKRGATRVCYVYFVRASTVYLFAIYGKSVQEDLTASEKKLFNRMIAELEKLH